MSNEMDLSLLLSGHKEIVANLREQADEAERAAKATEDQAKAVRSAAQSYRELGNGSGGMAIPQSVEAHVNKLMRGGGGLYQRRSRLGQARSLLDAFGGSNSEQGKDLDMAWSRVNKSIERAERPELGVAGRAAKALLSSRYGLGGMSPLIGQSLNVAGVNTSALPYQADKLASQFTKLGATGGRAGVMLNRFAGVAGNAGLVVAGVVQGFKRMQAFAQKAEQNGAIYADGARSFASDRTMAGTDSLGAAGIRGLGINSGDARALLERIKSDPVAMAEAGKMGISVTPGPQGTMDSARIALQIAERLRAMPEEQRHRTMYMMGPEAERLEPLTRVSDKTFRAMREMDDLEAGAYDEEGLKTSAEFDAVGQSRNRSKELIKMRINRLWQKVALPFMRIEADFFNQINRLTGGASTAESAHGGAAATAGADSIQGGAGATAQNTAEMAKNTAAIAMLTQNMRMMGGGPRAAGAIPAAMNRGDYLTAAAEAGAVPTGVL